MRIISEKNKKGAIIVNDFALDAIKDNFNPNLKEKKLVPTLDDPTKMGADMDKNWDKELKKRRMPSLSKMDKSLEGSTPLAEGSGDEREEIYSRELDKQDVA